MRRTGAHAWLYVITYVVLSIMQATLAASQAQSPQVQFPYLLGVGELFSVTLSKVCDLSHLCYGFTGIGDITG